MRVSFSHRQLTLCIILLRSCQFSVFTSTQGIEEGELVYADFAPVLTYIPFMYIMKQSLLVPRGKIMNIRRGAFDNGKVLLETYLSKLKVTDFAVNETSIL